MKCKKQLLIGAALTTAVLISNPAHALFVNGGFETGDLSGWDLSFARSYTTNYSSLSWTAADHGRYGVWDSNSTMQGQTLDVDPYNGNYMARLNDIFGSYHATRISQTDTIFQQDIDDGAVLYVN